MPRFIHRFVALSVVCAGCAFGQQGSFAQIAYGGSWQTTITLINESNTLPANVTLSFFGDSGSPLSAPVLGVGNTSSYSFAIVPGGLQSVVLFSSAPVTSQGWANMNVASGIPVRGLGSFRFLLPNGTISEAVVPLSISDSAVCIVPSLSVPGSPSVILVPFDNTTGQYTTSLALANTTSGFLSVPIEFDDQSDKLLVTDTLVLTAMQHVAVVTPQAYPILAGKKGVLRIRQSTAFVTLLGLLSNNTNAITTIIPITN
jgi:hypothetical protein